MEDLRRNSRPLRHGDGLPHGFHHPGRLVPHVGKIQPPPLRQPPGDLLHLSGSGVHPGRINQAAGHAEGPFLQSGPGHLPHLPQLVRRGKTVFEPQDVQADRPVPHEGSHVEPEIQPIQHVKVFGEGPPVPLRRHSRPDEARVGVQEGHPLVPDGGGADAALPHQDGGDTLPELGHPRTLPEQQEIVVGVHVDETGSQHLAPRVDLLSAGHSGRKGPHGRDHAVPHPRVAPVPGRPRPVHYPRVPYHKVKIRHGCTSALFFYRPSAIICSRISASAGQNS